ncbi:TetR/AcrR family transcriptional regulator [Pelomonas sp. P7]|uniref:TetR/AcrR family transcriptional regulator n=1 Tax=Pelomonas caseinilytica TaxID=2906763 RepID=A0ABS8XG03_9BURK|nr:TetR/AcrR family transcriptional regulator [Pelomonas sp. P7]MCE4539809.1 TetR/AcrR family transcriptional regulator [Pelomonas sp. P7]
MPTPLPRKPRARPATAAPPDVAPKKAPTQPRAVETYERILAMAAELLGEVGIEQLSTNLICRRLAITPPALYQYFPNKYAILHELGQRLMQRQNELLEPWATPATMALPEARYAKSVAKLFLETLRLTEQMPAGVWVTRALRAVPSLKDVRIRSHDAVTDLLLQAFMAAHPNVDPARARVSIRLAIDAQYAALELLFDDPSQSPEAVAEVMAEMVAGELARLRRKY